MSSSQNKSNSRRLWIWRHSLQTAEINMGCCWRWWISVTPRTLCWWAATRATVVVVVAAAAAAASRFRTRWRCGLVTSWFPPACVESWSLTRGQFVVQTDGPSGQTTANQFLEHLVRPVLDPTISKLSRGRKTGRCDWCAVSTRHMCRLTSASWSLIEHRPGGTITREKICISYAHLIKLWQAHCISRRLLVVCINAVLSANQMDQLKAVTRNLFLGVFSPVLSVTFFPPFLPFPSLFPASKWLSNPTKGFEWAQLAPPVAENEATDTFPGL